MICRRRLARVMSLVSGAGKKPFRRQCRASSNRMRMASGSSTWHRTICRKRQADIPAEKELRCLPLRIQHCQVCHDLSPDPQVLQGLMVWLQLQSDTSRPCGCCSRSCTISTWPPLAAKCRGELSWPLSRFGLESSSVSPSQALR
ncbi:hypothetical protein INR49_026149 [Caranx melampygus]|nr:hypothetical protein INR49_026149 [Caranx melampygus]